MKRYRLYPFLLFLSLTSFDALHAQQILLTNANIIDPSTRTVGEGALLIDGDQIHSVVMEIPEGFDGDIVDVSGKWIIPGLHDMHVPLGGQKGSIANLVVLNGSPIEDIRNTQHIEMVIYRGKIIDRPGILSAAR